MRYSVIEYDMIQCNIAIEHNTPWYSAYIYIYIHISLSPMFKENPTNRTFHEGNQKKHLCISAPSKGLPCHILAKDKASTPRWNHLRGDREKNPIRRFLGWNPEKHSPKKLTGEFYRESSKTSPLKCQKKVTQLPRFLLLVQYVYTVSIHIYIYIHILLDQSCGFVFLLQADPLQERFSKTSRLQ